mgnify:CR=1 FL=1
MPVELTKHRIKILLAAKILEKRREYITAKSLSDMTQTSKASAADKVKYLQPDYFSFGVPIAHSTNGRTMRYSLTPKANEVIREHLTTIADTQ